MTAPIKGLAALLALTLAGCALEAVFDPSHPPPESRPSPLDYRQLVIDNDITKMMRKNATGPLEIAGLRQSVGSQPGDWMTCIRAWQNGQQTHLAVFFKDDAIVESRGGVMSDGCEQDSFSVLVPDNGPY